MINLLQWLNFPIFPMLPQLPFNFMNFHGNEGALGAAVSPAMFMPSNLMHVQSAPAQVHQQPALGVESELNRTQEYPVSLKLAFCKWKEGFESMLCQSHFKSTFGNVKAFNLKNLKLSLSPSPQWPEAACGWGAMAGKFLRQTKGRTVFGLESFESIP